MVLFKLESMLPICHRILFLDLRPYRFRDKKEDLFKMKLSKTSKTTYWQQPHVTVEFLPAFSNKLSYYRQMICNDMATAFNTLTDNINRAVDAEEKQYHTYWLLHKGVEEKIRQVREEIDQRDYKFVYLSTESEMRKTNPSHTEETWIYQLMKLELLALYLNLFHTYGQYLEEEMPTEEQLYYIFFGEQAPNPSYFRIAEKIVSPLVPVDKVKAVGFAPVRDDLNGGETEKMSYGHLRSPDRFADIEQRLFEYEIIDTNYHFIKNRKQSNHTLLAAVYRELINRNYFNRHVLRSRKRLSDNDIRIYLDKRYAVDLSQQFRKLTEGQREFARLKLPWLERILFIP